MDKPTKIVTNCSTGVTEIIELTDAEIAIAQADVTAYEAEAAAREAEAAARATLKASAKAKLVAGEPLTEAEAATIVL